MTEERVGGRNLGREGGREGGRVRGVREVHSVFDRRKTIIIIIKIAEI